MKKIITLLMLMCAIILVGGCTPTERDLEKEMEFDDIKNEIYIKAYEEGYKDATRAVVDELPSYLIDVYELEDALDIIFDDSGYSDEIRDQIFTYCEVYEEKDFAIEYSNDEMDYNY